jgi:hypothetical protein
MKNKIFLIILLLSAMKLTAQGSFEQYCYVEKDKASVWVPILHYQSKKGWYAEGRYNYESVNTFSLYAGKKFSRQSKLSTSVTPLLGAVVGNFKGVSAGLNITLDYRKFFFDSQSQYTISSNSDNLDFFFSWSELTYQPFQWIYFGLSTQHTYYSAVDETSFESGAVTGFHLGKWTFPVYCFNITDNERYFVLGVNLDLGQNKKIMR